MKKFRFTREVRDLVVTMVFAAWAPANIKIEPVSILALVGLVAIALPVAAVVLKAFQRPSEVLRRPSGNRGANVC